MAPKNRFWYRTSRHWSKTLTLPEIYVGHQKALKNNFPKSTIRTNIRSLLLVRLCCDYDDNHTLAFLNFFDYNLMLLANR